MNIFSYNIVSKILLTVLQEAAVVDGHLVTLLRLLRPLASGLQRDLHLEALLAPHSLALHPPH